MNWHVKDDYNEKKLIEISFKDTVNTCLKIFWTISAFIPQQSLKKRFIGGKFIWQNNK